jgi:hypothetical protein
MINSCPLEEIRKRKRETRSSYSAAPRLPPDETWGDCCSPSIDINPFDFNT